MISFDELGRKGNLGNQMFQYAALRGLAHHRGFDWIVPPQDPTRIHDYALTRYFKMEALDASRVGYSNFRTYFSKSGDQHNSTGFEFDQDFFDNCPDNVNINGFFQSEKYFSGIANEIRRDFTFQDSHSEATQELRTAVGGEFTGVHVRRGDYLKYPKHHPVLDLDYYNRALEHLKPMPVVIFTNDKAWVRESKFLHTHEPIVAEFDDYGHDMCLMSQAKQMVIANSTFSWWGAWLSGSTEVVAPKSWFGKKLRKQTTRDLYPSQWVVL